MNDIVVEVEKQLGSLKRQASKARRFSEIRDQMRAIVRQMLAGKARELDQEAERLATQLAEMTATETQTCHVHQAAGRRSRPVEPTHLRTGCGDPAKSECVEPDGAGSGSRENRISFNRQRSEELAVRQGVVSSEFSQATTQAAECERRSAAQESGGDLLAEEAETLSGARGRAGWTRAIAAYADHRLRGTHRSAAALGSGSGRELLRLHGEQKQAEEALVHQAQALSKLEASEHDMLESSIRLRDDADQAAHEFESASGQLSTLKQAAVKLLASISELREKSGSLKEQAEALRDSLSGVRARHSTLTQVLNDRSYTADAVQKLFAANERGGWTDFAPSACCADYAEVEAQHEAAIEQYLRDELEYVVVETYDHARAGVSLLRNEVGGRATFFVDSLRTLKYLEYEPIVNFRAEDGVISRLDKLVEFRDPLGAAAKQFLPRLKAAYLATAPARRKDWRATIRNSRS